MTWFPKPDPYDGFKDDRERRRALNTRVRCYCMAVVAMALTGSPTEWMEKFAWIKNWFH